MSTNHENLPDVLGAAQAMLSIKDYGVKSPLDILEIQVPEQYKEAVRVYGGYSQQIYESPAVARLIGQYNYHTEHEGLVDVTHISPDNSSEHIFLEIGDTEHPKLLFAVSAHVLPDYELFQAKVADQYGDELGNPWKFQNANRLYGYFGNTPLHYYIAVRNFSADVLWKNHALFNVFVDRTKFIFQDLQQKLREGVKVPNQEQTENILPSVIQANAILGEALGRQ